MGIQRRVTGAALALTLLAHAASAQDNPQTNKVVLPTIDVSASRTGTGIAGTSTTIITAEDIARAPQATLQDILSREAGIQTTSLYNGVNGTGTAVDMRGFGVTAPSNVLVLLDGRRFNDSDLTGFDFSLIPRNSIERIEITRGNSGAVLYGDGAVGGVINIVTRNGVGSPPTATVETGFGPLGTREGKISASTSYGPFSTAVYGNSFRSDGYRDFNMTQQNQGVGDIRYKTDQWSAFFNVAIDDLRQHLPGPRNIAAGPFVGNFNEYLSARRGSNSPLDFAKRQNVAMRGGVTANLWSGGELILDSSVRRKNTQFGSFFTLGGFGVDNSPSSYNFTELSAASFTPRLNVDQTWGNLRLRMLAGMDIYKTTYQSDRTAFEGATPIHIYNFNQVTTAFYAQPTVTIHNDTDISIGGRTQRNTFQARDAFDPNAPVSLLGASPAGQPLDSKETQRAAHLGVEHRFGSMFAVFGRMAQSFRVPNIDERVGASAIFVPTDFNLRTQRSRDVEGGGRIHWGKFDLQSSIYDMYLIDELHFSPITFSNVNLDPTRRYGVENTASYQLLDNVRLKATASYTRAVFRAGPFAGRDVPEVARRTGSGSVTWDIVPKYLSFDGVVRYVGKRFMDGDEANSGRMLIPSYAVVDLRLGGAIDKFFWSVSVQNAFNRLYFDYGLDTSFPGNQFFSVYPLQGRTYMARAGATF